ncbi:MAG: CPBP family intramembrane glutamic endopeptidase, partial [Actinomycetota bacterium]
CISLTRIYDRKSGLKELLKSAISYRIGFQVLAVIVLYPVIIGLFQLFIINLTGGSFDYSQFIKQLPSILPLVILGPLSEEFGWRGFLQKRVNTEFSPVIGSIVIGVVWALWHLPLFYLPGTSQHDFSIPFIPCFFSLVFTTFVYTWGYLNSHQSLLSAILLHWVGTYVMQVISSQVTRSVEYNYLEVLPSVLIGTVFIILLLKRRRYSN